MVCGGTGCVSCGSLEVRGALREEIARQKLSEEVEIVTTGCNGFCGAGPLVVVHPEGTFYQKVTTKDVPLLVEEHLLKGRPVPKLMYTPPEAAQPVPLMRDVPFFQHQMLVTLRNRGLIDPEKIDEYIARDGYLALAKALTAMSPEEVIEEITRSGLRGRGGGGFPTGVKWRTCRHARLEREKPAYVVCNADEGDPGAFMDRSVLESDPHSVIEGMLIGAYAIGSHEGYVYVRKEYPLALQRLRKAIEDAREYGLLGDNILDSDLCFDIHIHQGAGAFVCGESTALMASMEGRVGEPRAKYIHTVEHGFRDCPTNLNNVETWANVPPIISRGAEWFTSIGTGDVSEDPWGGSKGTKVFSLVGNVNNTGLVEVPMGITLREIIFDIGGGIPNGKSFKAVQTGGPSGGCLPDSLLDLPVDFDRLTEAGSMMGSGGMIVMDEDTCMVDVAKYFLDFLKEESCGKCVPCREGIRRMLEVLELLTEGRGEEGHIELLEEIGQCVEDTSLCALGGTAPYPVLSTIKYFRDEYEAHIRDRACPGGVCKALLHYRIDPDRCDGCMLCAKECPADAITGEKKGPHVINEELCTKCGICYDVCRQDAVLK
jgi:NADH:ubiquinone oxidoreductase subunit F (NADH-binding)/(2Fe-2S) ferredoxin